MRRVLLVVAASTLMVGAAQGASVPRSLPSSEIPNGPGEITVPFALSTPPAVPERRSYDQLLELWQRAGAAYGVPWQVLASINKIESNFGRNMGPSSAGAVGWMQFMPSTWARWGMDANGDGIANPWNPDDAVYSAARYLAAAGARDDIERAIFAYNHAQWYVDDVLELTAVFGSGGGFDPSLAGSPLPAPAGPELVFRVDDIEKRLDAARGDVTEAQRAVVAAEKELANFDARVLAAEGRAGDPTLSDAEFRKLEVEVTRLVLAQEEAAAAIEQRRVDLADAVARLDELEREASVQASAITFSRPLSNGLGTPQFAGNYVFPVGGGPETVEVPRDHHDYPAVDVAAPEGAPLYALADSVVVYAHHSPTSKCGIGFKIETADGRRWLYCHLSYIEPNVVAGATLDAGTPVGLVGATGNATGPHLHLQLVPATTWPQQEPWFQSFAGVEFRWQGDPPRPAAAPAFAPPTSSKPGRVFDVVEDDDAVTP